LSLTLVVPIKQVASLDEDFELLDTGQVDPDFIQWELNEWDTFSLELALELRESMRGEGDEVVVVTVGDATADEGLLSCLAKGADRAVRVWDESLQGADALAIARVLAAVVERESADLVLCGVQSSDAVNGATGIALAGYLDLPHVAVVRRVEYEAESATLTVERELEGGLVEVVRLGAPALLTIQTGINEPRYATLRAIKLASGKPLEVAGLDELSLDRGAVAVAAGSRRTALLTPDRGDGAEMLDGPPVAVAARIVKLVQERMRG
jgi:electron transfer flavoprotein beta subunit